jgi:hypothetical protein
MADKNLWMKHVDKKYVHSFPSGKKVPYDIMELEKFTIQGPDGELKFDWDLAKQIFRIDSYRESISYLHLGPNLGDIYMGGFYLLRQNLFKAKASLTSLQRMMNRSKGKLAISQMSFISQCKTVGKPKPGNRFQVAIPTADYLLALDKGITVDMVAELNEYQREVVKLNKNLSDEVKLWLELNH